MSPLARSGPSYWVGLLLLLCYGLGDSDQHRLRVPGVLHASGNLGRIVARKTGVAELRWIAARGPQHPLEREIAESVHPQVPADLLDTVIGPDQLALRGCVDAVVAGPRDRWRSDAEVYLFGAGVPDQLDQRLAGRPADDGVVHHHDLLPLQHLAHRIELDLHPGGASRLHRLNERAAHVVVADQRMLQLHARHFREPE